jgi:hypothetical protein
MKMFFNVGAEFACFVKDLEWLWCSAKEISVLVFPNYFYTKWGDGFELWNMRRRPDL